MNRKKNKTCINLPIELDQHVGNESYADIIIQLTKYLLYVRGQIPFNYDTFRLLLNANKSKFEKEDVRKQNVLATKRFKLYETTLKSINRLLENLEEEIKANFENIQQISILFGGTPFSPKEVYAINKQACSCSNLCRINSKERHHVMLDVLRSLFKSEQLRHLMFDPLPLTNMYILIQKGADISEKTDFFLPKDSYQIPSICPHVNFNFNKRNDLMETSAETSSSNNEAMSLADNEIIDIVQPNSKESSLQKWFQSIEIIKGIKDEMINGHSIWS